MTSHTELQEAMERLQTDTGQKESELNILRRDKYVFYHLGEISQGPVQTTLENLETQLCC